MKKSETRVSYRPIPIALFLDGYILHMKFFIENETRYRDMELLFHLFS